MAFNIFPLCALMIFFFLLESNEAEILVMSFTMGVKMVSFIIVFYIVLTFSLLILGGLLIVMFKLLVFKVTNWTLQTSAFILATYSSITQAVFFLFALGKIGVAIFMLIQGV